MTIPEIDFNLQLVSFFELGYAWNNDNLPIETSVLSSLGIGINLTAYDRFNANFYWGIPLIDFPTIGNSLQEQGIYFSIEYQLLKF